MIYSMNLSDAPFNLIKSGQKSVEMRLNKNGRENIRPFDEIIFTNNKDGTKLSVLVLKIDKFPSFQELYASYDKSLLGYKDDEIADPNDMLAYYTQEDIDKFGVLGITIKIKD